MKKLYQKKKKVHQELLPQMLTLNTPKLKLTLNLRKYSYYWKLRTNVS